MNAKLSFKLLSLTLFLPMMSMVAEAASLSPEQALRRVQSSGPVYRMPGDRQLTLKYTGKSAGENVLYVFNSGDNGFIVASADDRMPPLLGYSDKGSFDMENISPEFKWWLSRYEEEAESFFSSDAARNYVYSATRSDKESIPVLLSTQWNQDEPYNQDCPTDAGGRCVTGCVATAMAQVINYHAYPVSGTGSHSYIWNGKSLSFDYAGAVFDYGNMLDSYYGDSSDVQKAAVANLMYACGVSVDMNYSSYESGAWDGMVLSALKDYFNYDTAMQYMMRDFYSNEEWNDLVYTELKERRPVLYSGSSEDGGHMFVCDGYQGGYFHMNWGWGGYNDGWFLLSALNPDGQGIGGNEGGFNLGQSVICGVQPNKNTSLSSYYLLATGSYGVEEITSDSMVELHFSNDGGVYNYSAQYIETQFYLKAVSQNGEETLSEGVPLRFEGAFRGFRTLYLNLPSVGEGDYKVYVVFDGPQGQLQQLPVPLQDKDFMNMKVDAEGNVSFFDGLEQPDITVTELTPLSDVVARKSVDFNLSVRNSGAVSYSGTVYIRCYAAGSEDIVSEQPVQVSVRSGQTLSETVNMVFDVPAGDYELRCFDAFGNSCSGSFPLSVAENPEVMKIVVTQFLQDGEVVSGQPAIFDISLKNEGNVLYDGYFSVKTYKPGSDSTIYTYKIGIALEPGQEFNGWVELAYDLPDGEYEQRCFDMFGHPCSETFPLVIGTRQDVVATGINLDKAEATLVVGDSVTLTATVAPENVTDRTVTWSSSDTSVATVDNGVVSAVAPGTAVITASTSNGLTAQCAVTVEPRIVYATSISLDITAIEAEIGSTFTLIATVLPDDTTDKTVSWSSSDESVAVVDQAGNVTVVAMGDAVITAVTTDGSDLSAQCTVNGIMSVPSLISSGMVDIYSLDGILLRKNADSEFIDNLSKGTYIIRALDRSYKIIKR